MAPQRFINHSFPQPLQLAVWCSYINGIYALLGLGTGLAGFLGLIAILGAVGAWVMVNGKTWGYIACCVAGAIGFAVGVLLFINVGLGAGLNLLFSGALLAGLVHPLSRKYVTVWLD
jgi:hypothetical protein